MLSLVYMHSRGWGRHTQLVSYRLCVILHAVQITTWDPYFARTTKCNLEMIYSTLKQQKQATYSSTKLQKLSRRSIIPWLSRPTLTHGSRKTWKTINKLSNDYAQPQQQCKVTHQLLLNGKVNSTYWPSKAKIPDNHITEHSLISPFTMEQMKCTKILNNNKATGLDGMICEHLGTKAFVWLKELMNNILLSKKFPNLWRMSKVIAILKPGKDSSLFKSFRPISLLCHTYKLFDWMILNRLNPIIEHISIREQAGFRAGQVCTSQLLNLAQYIEDEYEKSLTTHLWSSSQTPKWGDYFRHTKTQTKHMERAHWDHRHNTHTLWKTIHGLSNRAPPHTLNTSITFNNKIATTPKHIANCFTKQFTNTVKHATHKTSIHIKRATHNIQGYNITLLLRSKRL